MSDNKQLVVIKKVKLFHETDKAILIGPYYLKQDSKEGKTWIPSSLINHSTFDAVGDVGEIEIPQWVADQNDLNYENPEDI